MTDSDLIERLRDAAADAAEEEYGVSGLLTEAAAALEAARDGATPPATSPVRILIDAIESEIRHLEGKAGWMPQAVRIAILRAAIDQARGKGGVEVEGG